MLASCLCQVRLHGESDMRLCLRCWGSLCHLLVTSVCCAWLHVAACVRSCLVCAGDDVQLSSFTAPSVRGVLVTCTAVCVCWRSVGRALLRVCLGGRCARDDTASPAHLTMLHNGSRRAALQVAGTTAAGHAFTGAHGAKGRNKSGWQRLSRWLYTVRPGYWLLV